MESSAKLSAYNPRLKWSMLPLGVKEGTVWLKVQDSYGKKDGLELKLFHPQLSGDEQTTVQSLSFLIWKMKRLSLFVKVTGECGIYFINCRTEVVQWWSVGQTWSTDVLGFSHTQNFLNLKLLQKIWLSGFLWKIPRGNNPMTGNNSCFLIQGMFSLVHSCLQNSPQLSPWEITHCITCQAPVGIRVWGLR